MNGISRNDEQGENGQDETGDGASPETPRPPSQFGKDRGQDPANDETVGCRGGKHGKGNVLPHAGPVRDSKECQCVRHQDGTTKSL